MQSFILEIKALIVILIAFIRNIIFLFSFLAIFDSKKNILARFPCRVFISKIIFIFASRLPKSTGLSILYNSLLDKRDWQSKSWLKCSAILQQMRLSKSNGVVKMRFIILFLIDSLYIAISIKTIYSIFDFCITSNSLSNFFIHVIDTLSSPYDS